MNNITQVFDEVNMFSNIWMSFATSTIGQWDMLEAYVSGGSFAIFIVFFRILDAVPAMNKYRLSPNTKPMPIVRPDQWKYNPWMPLLIYLAAIHLYHHFHPKPSPDISSPSVYRVVTEVILGIFAYDFIFFWIHYAMHVVPILSFMNHHVHHNQTTLSSSEVQHHSFLDGSFQVIVNILVQRIRTPFGPKHLLSRILHNVIITYMLTEIHAGYDFWWALHRLFPRLIGGARRHEFHHKNGNIGNYQQFFMYLDNLLGTAYEEEQLGLEKKTC